MPCSWIKRVFINFFHYRSWTHFTHILHKCFFSRIYMYYISFILIKLLLTIPFYQSEWVSNSCLTPINQFFNYVMARTSCISMRSRWCLLCTRLTRLVGFLIVLARWNSKSYLKHIILIQSKSLYAPIP